MKNETIEEAGVIAAGLCQHLEAKEQAMFIAGFIECAKWQADRMYSEQDLRQAYEHGMFSIIEQLKIDYCDCTDERLPMEQKDGSVVCVTCWRYIKLKVNK